MTAVSDTTPQRPLCGGDPADGTDKAPPKHNGVSYRVVAFLEVAAPEPLQTLWRKLIKETPRERSWISEELSKRTGMPILLRVEGGVGGGDNRKDKQLRFQSPRRCLDFGPRIVADLRNAEAEDGDAWSLEEAISMRDALKLCCEEALEETGCVECVLVVD